MDIINGSSTYTNDKCVKELIVNYMDIQLIFSQLDRKVEFDGILLDRYFPWPFFIGSILFQPLRLLKSSINFLNASKRSDLLALEFSIYLQ